MCFKTALHRQGVFKRRLQERLKTGMNPVHLSFVLCSEKDERLAGTDVMEVCTKISTIRCRYITFTSRCS
jgi:hypothetical protein